MADFTAGQTVTVKAGMFRRPGGIMIPRHTRIELTEDDIKRSDLDLLVMADEPPPEDRSSLSPVSDEPITGGEQNTENDGVHETGLDLNSSLTSEQLQPVIAGMTVAQAKEFLGREEWTYDNMQAAQEAEENGKARETLLDYIENRLLDLEEGDDGS